MRALTYVVLMFTLSLTMATTMSAFAVEQTVPTEDGILDVRLMYDTIELGDLTRLSIDFINPQTEKVQVHIDYIVTVSNNSGQSIFGPIPLTHTSEGSVKIPVLFEQEGEYIMDVQVEGILFNLIPAEIASFGITVVNNTATPPENVVQTDSPPMLDEVDNTNDNDNDNDNTNDNDSIDGGGCLIATAAYGSELAPQVQRLREIRDNVVLSTNSGTTFMTEFNQMYYSFSPFVADLEREYPIFKEVVKTTLTPLLMSLSLLLDYVEPGSEEQILVYGVSIILLNIGMYVVIPVLVSIMLLRMCARMVTKKMIQN